MKVIDLHMKETDDKMRKMLYHIKNEFEDW